MANPTLTGCGGNGNGGSGACGSAQLPSSPFYAPRYHFGMLLGVDDFETEQAYHRGKGRLHNAWLHGEGVVWGFDVDLPRTGGTGSPFRGEIRVLPGLALDAAGRELHLDAAACVAVADWYAAHRDDPEVRAAVTVAADGTVTLDAHVVARFSACAARPVPAIAEPCAEGGGGDVACSRALETVELLLLPGAAPRRTYPYHRLRVLFGLEAASGETSDDPSRDDQAVEDALAAVLALPADQQPAALLDAFRRFAALDEIDRQPAALAEGGVSLFPADDDTAVVLADVRGITLKPVTVDGKTKLVFDAAAVDVTVRPSHVATSTIQELLCGPRCLCPDGEPSGEEPSGGGEEATEPSLVAIPPPSSGSRIVRPDTARDAGGPRIDPASVVLGGERVTLSATQALSRASVRPDAFQVSAYDVRDGWHAVEVRETRVERNRRTVHLELMTGFGGNLVRVIARGTGPAPLLGTSLVPLAGSTDGPPGGEDDGHDFVIMLKRSET